MVGLAIFNPSYVAPYSTAPVTPATNQPSEFAPIQVPARGPANQSPARVHSTPSTIAISQDATAGICTPPVYQ